MYYDAIIIGAGITGLSIARELKRQSSGISILILEKEQRLGAHGSGRNSGVLHSGVYYPETSLKAKVCGRGAAAMAAFCEEYDLPINRIGKVIVPVRGEDDPQLELLYTRANNNGANVSMLDEFQLRDIEPEARSATGRALYSPDTAVVDPKSILECLYTLLRSEGVDILFNSPVLKADPDKNQVEISPDKKFTYGRLFNATGQFTDRIAHIFGIGKKYTLLPFKGIYYKLCKGSGLHINSLIYPVPDLNVPFLGVHSVKSIDDEIYFGPTAVPAFGREHYQGLKGIELQDGLSISYHLLQQYVRNRQGFRQFAHEEAGRFMKKKFTEAAQVLVPNLRQEHLVTSNKIGIRAQLLDREKHELVMDFLIERKDNTVHVLNAVSPAFTSAFEFAKHVVSEVKI
jgi:L-2-hydroxyglutarate oxidase LhgO